VNQPVAPPAEIAPDTLEVVIEALSVGISGVDAAQRVVLANLACCA